MFQRALSFGGLLVQAGALLILMPGSGEAAGPGGHGGHGGGGGFHGSYGGGAHFGGFNHGGFYGHPNAYHGYQHSYGGYNRGYGHGLYYPYYGGSYGYPSYGYYGSYNPYSYASPGVTGDSGYSGSYGDVTPSSPDGYIAVAPPAGGYRSFYPPAPAEPDPSAHVTVNVPAGAQLWFDDTLTTSTGSVREFDSPPLTSGSRYSYEIRARWNENGQEVTQTQHVGVAAGAHVSVSFPIPSKTVGQVSAAK